MRRLRALWIRLCHGLNWKRRDEDFAAELESHLQMHIDDNLHSGMSLEQARRDALIKLGGMEQVKQAHRERSMLPFWENLGREMRLAFRTLRKSPGFSAAIMVTLVLGIGMTTAMFTLVYSTLLRDLPYPGADRIVRILDVRVSGQSTGMLVGMPRFFDVRERSKSFEHLGFFFFGHETLNADKHLPLVLRTAATDADFWNVFE